MGGVVSQTTDVTAAVTSGTSGKMLNVLQDNIQQVTDENLKASCYYLRTYRVSYNFVVDNQDQVVYYTVQQCLAQDMALVHQKVYFSSTESGMGEPLPAGCPPPIIQPPQAPDPCQNGFKVGDVISRTVARLVVPTLVKDTDTNPIAQEPIFRDYIKLQAEANSPDFTTFTEEQQKVIEKFKELITAAANDKIKCFTEEVTPVKEMDIKFVCAKEGAYQSIAEALKAALGDQITCQHIACDDIQKSLTEQMAHDTNASVGGTVSSTLAPGDADVFGNIQSPLENVPYLIVSKPASLAVGPATAIERDAALELETCVGDDSERFLFVKTGSTDFWKIKTALGDQYLTYDSLGGNLVYRPLTNGPEQNWRPRINADGSVSFVNEKEPVLMNLDGGLTVTSTHIVTLSAMGSSAEKFLIRKDCLKPVTPGSPLLSGNIPLPLPGETYFLRNAGSLLVLNDAAGVQAGGALAQNTCGKHANQSWRFTQRADGNWIIANGDLLLTFDSTAGMILDVPAVNKHQAWKLSSDDQGVLSIRAVDDIAYGPIVADSLENSTLIYGPGRDVPLELWAIRKTC